MREQKDFQDFHIDVPPGASGEAQTTCPECSHTRRKNPKAKCLSVNVEKGVWICHHCDWSGSLRQGVERRADPFSWRPKVYNRPAYVARPAADSLVHWFATRGISAATVEAFQVRLEEVYFPALEDHALAVQFPYYRDGQCVNIKSRGYHEKTFRQEADAEKILQNLDAIVNSTEAAIFEGELDVMAAHEAHYPYGLSVPDGAPPPHSKPSEKKFEYLANCEAELGKLEKIILAVDNDEPGKVLEAELVRRLGPERCWRVQWPEGCKDANDVLVKRGPAALREALAQARPWPIEDVLTFDDIMELVNTYYYRPRQGGVTTGWPSLDAHFTVRPGEVTVVTGIPAHGKSNFVDALAVNLATDHGWCWALCSPEHLPIERHAAMLIEKESAMPFFPGPHPRISPGRMVESMEWLDRFFCFIAPSEALTIEAVLAKAKALVLRRGINALVLDPWNEFDHHRPGTFSETEYISEALGKIRRFARNHQVHVFIIAHPAKLKRRDDGTYPVPTPWDIAGSAHWRNKPDNVLCIWRDQNAETTTVEIHVQKVKFKEVGREGKVELAWIRHTGRYVENWPPDTGGVEDAP